MSEIASIAGEKGDAGLFSVSGCSEFGRDIQTDKKDKNMAKSYIQTWQANAVTSEDVNFFYGDTNSNGLMYNLYADVLLGLGFVPSSVYDVLTSYYNNIGRECVRTIIVGNLSNGIFTGQQPYGIPLENEIPSLTSICT